MRGMRGVIIIAYLTLSGLVNPAVLVVLRDTKIIVTASAGDMEEWTTAIEQGDVEKVKNLLEVPHSLLVEADLREEKMREMLEPIDQNFKYWMEWGHGVNFEAMLDSLHSVPFVVYKLDPVTPLHEAQRWLEQRLVENRTPVQYDAKILLEKANWLLLEQIHEIQTLEGHLYSLNRLTIGKTSAEIAKELGRLGIAFYSELGILKWNKHHPLGTPAQALKEFFTIWSKEANESNQISNEIVFDPILTISGDYFRVTESPINNQI